MADLLCKTVKIVVLAMSSRVAYPLLLRELGGLQGMIGRSKNLRRNSTKNSMRQREFRREAAKENKRDKVNEKRRKLETKVNEAYAKFSEKVDEENRRFDEKRDKIIDKIRKK
jgi:biopolymer transport protein ExbB/TolQ